MPRGLDGYRPVVYADTTTRIAYAALVEAALPVLDPPSRSEANRWEFRNLGTDESKPGYVILSDIASCYEYIAPAILSDELFMRSDDFELVRHLLDLLQHLTTLERGIPQMLQPSDRLADLYLSRIDRSLERSGLRWMRTADDYKVVVPSWDETAGALELLDREVRNVGLILSAEKTRIVRAGVKAKARSSSSPETDAEVEDEDEETSPIEALMEWHEYWRERTRTGVMNVPDPPPTREIRRLSSAEDVTADLLADLVFAYPPHLEYVVGILARLVSASDENDALAGEAFSKILEQSRPTSWNMLWLLEGASTLLRTGRMSKSVDAKAAAIRGLKDDKEVVRAQSAWFLARFHSLRLGNIQDLHLHASYLTLPAVSAAATLAAMRADGDESRKLKQLASAIIAKQPLSEMAAAWAKTHV
ncbi:reverse transcriptase domain-containing protein [Micromonospora sp. NPDC047467]|uniref:reverse transcriptase domain-containing protein n=1 Tax=Micromonospora sp. NPDC047467 TaxID=3154814 RepID=UPI0033CDD7DF